MFDEGKTMAESKFITSLVKSLQIICNGQIDFNESIELVGYVNVVVDHQFKYDYVVDEHVSKKQHDTSTNFVSNSYYSSRPSRNQIQSVPFEESITRSINKTGDILDDDDSRNFENFDSVGLSQQKYAVRYENTSTRDLGESHAGIKLEGHPDDCIMMPESPGLPDNHQPVQTKKQRFSNKKDPTDEDLQMKLQSENFDFRSKEAIVNNDIYRKQSNYDLKASLRKEVDALENVKHVISKLVSLCEEPASLPEKYNENSSYKFKADNIKMMKRKLLDHFHKDKVKKMKDVLKTKKGKRRKHDLKALIGETGLTNEQLLLLAHNIPQCHRRVNWKGIPDGPDKKEMLREHRKALRNRTQERQERLLEMAEMLKNNQLNEQGISIISKGGVRKCTLNKSSISVVSHNTQQLTLENIDEAIDALTGKVKRAILPYKRSDKNDDYKLDSHKKHVVKRKVKQLIGKILNEVSESGYRAVYTNTVGSDAGSHSAELVILPLRVDEFLPENKETDVKSEMSENEYAKQLEREQFIEKQKANEEKMKELEDKLIRILTGTEEIYIPTKKRYAPGEIRPTDAERMKEYRKRLKEDPEKYQMIKQKQAMGKKLRRLSSLAVKVKDASGSRQVLPNNSVSDVPQSVSSLVSITQPTVGNVSIHCPQVYDPQPPSSAVNVHRSNQFVGQVSGMHNNHQQPMGYGSELDIVELIAATHNVQNQHFQ